ncbi:MAG: SpoIIE family protein phosphatase [Actinomycetota bacterium]|nr:SpoIIE family protein phosphatase [Actinomycetota bacterium]
MAREAAGAARSAQPADVLSVLPAPLAERLSLGSLGLDGLVECSEGIRLATAGTGSLEQAAQRITDFLHTTFVDGDRSACVLTRVFATARTGELSGDLAAQVIDARAEDPCLVLLATTGDLPQWRDRRQSAGHQVINLAGNRPGDPLAGLPMVKGLFGKFGVVPTELGSSPSGLAFTDFGVFHVETALGSPSLPAQDFVREHGVRSVIGFGCALPDGRVIAVLLFSRVTITPEKADLFRTLAVSLQLALVPLSGAPLFAGDPAGRPSPPALIDAANRRALDQLVTVLGGTVRSQARQLSIEAAVVEELRRLGSELAGELELDHLVDHVVHAAVRTTGAAFGAFFYNSVTADGESYLLYSLAGADRSQFETFPMPGPTAIFAPTFRGEGVIHSDDITQDPRYGHNDYGGMPPGHLPVRSYLAAPVISRDGEVLGGLFLGHPDEGVFSVRAQALLVGLAGHAAVGIDNARLFTEQRQAAVALQHSLLPGDLPARPGLDFSAHYRPGAAGSATLVGGDWYDVVPLADDRSALVIGDVMGRGVRAAAAMGQLRTALRVLLASGHPPDAALQTLNGLLHDLPDERIATCAVGIYDPARHTLEIASAGHLPVLVCRPGDDPEYLGVDPAAPLGALGDAAAVLTVPFPPGSRLLMFTDGLVERRDESISAGLGRLLAHVAGAEDALELDTLIGAMLSEGQDDDTAALLVRATATAG